MTRFILIIAILVVCLCGVVARAGTLVNVTQEHNNPANNTDADADCLIYAYCYTNGDSYGFCDEYT
jgi:hypothetical protein